MKFNWKYRYVPEGQLEPDKLGRWALDCAIEVHILKAMPSHKGFRDFMGDYIPVVIATIVQQNIVDGQLPALHRYYANVPTFNEAVNFGFNTKNFYSNDLQDLKRQIERNFLHIRQVFKNVRLK